MGHGVGIPEDQLQAVFEEYHQLDNAAMNCDAVSVSVCRSCSG